MSNDSLPTDSLSDSQHATVPDRTVKLPSGGDMPLLGFGTWQITGDAATHATTWALEAGYRHIDTATMYRNEMSIGAALAQCGLPRESLFVTTKLPPQRVGQEAETIRTSLELLGLDYVDLWLIHWPPDDGVGVDVWREFGRARDDGLTRDIGVSNYSLEQIDRLADETGVKPAVNQIRWSPLLFDAAVLNGHRERGIVLEGYSGLRGGTLDHPVINDIAKKLDRTPAQVIIRWHLEHETVVIPKSTSKERITSNASVADFELSSDDVATLDALGSGAN